MITEKVIDQSSGRVKLTPWYRGIGNRDTIFYLWRMMEEENATKYVFYGQDYEPEDEPLRGDLVDFVRYFEPLVGDTKQILITQTQADELMGYSWYEKITLGVRANCGVFYKRKFWGSMAREASRASIDWAFDKLEIKELIAYTPWKWAINHCLWLGMTVIDTVPAMCLLNNIPRRIEFKGKPLEVTVLRISKEEFYGKQKT